VSVGVSNDTAQFSVASILAWWRQLGRERFPDAGGLWITADCGGSNSHRARLWKIELQKLADVIGIPITACHFPPGTSKWNKVEHRLFSYVSMNWRGKPLISHQVIISLIAASRTGTGRAVDVRLDQAEYPKGIKVSDKQLEAVNLHGHRSIPNGITRSAPARRQQQHARTLPCPRSPRPDTRENPWRARRGPDRASPPTAQAAPDRRRTPRLGRRRSIRSRPRRDRHACPDHRHPRSRDQPRPTAARDPR
jgi:Rhodopirellula transposase DDE domain